MRESKCPCAVMLDNKGPEVAICLEPDDNIHISQGQLLTLTTEAVKATNACIPVRSPHPLARIRCRE
jgi:pyruvate kinase